MIFIQFLLTWVIVGGISCFGFGIDTFIVNMFFTILFGFVVCLKKCKTINSWYEGQWGPNK